VCLQELEVERYEELYCVIFLRWYITGVKRSYNVVKDHCTSKHLRGHDGACCPYRLCDVHETRYKRVVHQCNVRLIAHLRMDDTWSNVAIAEYFFKPRS
jgi:hypothetical protein